MSAKSRASAQPAMSADQHRAEAMPFSMHGMCMAAAASITLMGTGALASVSLVARTLITLILGILGLGVLISLSGLTGLGGLVGLIEGHSPGVSQGD